MPDFEKYVARHGEIGAQEIVECMERYEGIYVPPVLPLEDRWNAVMQPPSSTQQYMAA